ncbi:hypothetical protein PQZ37_00775 [bacterium]|nr:hypothetical protein [bacterium]
MARLQFKSSTQRKGFNPVQVSTQGLSRMREETNRVVQGMERNAAAEKEQRDRELQALKEDTAYSERMADINYRIEKDNLDRQSQAATSVANRDQQQAQYNAAAQQSVLESISSFSAQAQKKAAENTAQQLKDQTDLAMSIDISGSLITQEALTNYNKNVSTLAQGANQESTDIIEEGFASGAGLYDTTRALANAAGLGAVGRQVLRNRLYSQSYGIILGKALKSTENNYQLADGTPFSGIEAYKDPEKQLIIQQQVTRQLSGMMRETYGITDPLYLAKGKTEVEKQNAVRISQAEAQGTAANFIQLRQQASDIASGGTYDNYATAFDIIKKVDGVQKAHEFHYKTMLNATDDEYRIGMSIDLMGNGKTYAEQWPGKYRLLETARRTQAIQQQAEQNRANRLEYLAVEKAAFNEDTEQRMTNNPYGVYAEFENKAAEYGQVPSQYVKNAHSAAVKGMQPQALQEVNARFKSGTLTRDYVESIQDPAVFKQAKEQYALQEQNKFGPDSVRTQKDLEGLADEMTKYGGEGEKGVENGYVLQALRRRYRELLPDYGAKEAYNKLTEEVAAAPKTAEDAKGAQANNIFQSVTTTDNRVTFPKLLSDPSDQKARMKAIDTRAISDEASAADAGIPGHVITKKELANLREQADSKFVDYITYPQTVLKFAAKYKDRETGQPLLPSEVVNQAIIGLNKADGGNRPPLTLTPTMQMVDAASPDVRKLLNSESINQKRRGLTQVTGQTSNHMRLKRSFTGALTYDGNVDSYRQTGTVLQEAGFKVAEHPDFGGTAPVHAGNSYHGYGEAFDVTHQTGDYNTSIEKTRLLKEAIRNLSLFKEVIGPGDGDPNHATHLHLGGLMRPITQKDIEIINSFR